VVVQFLDNGGIVVHHYLSWSFFLM